MGKFSKGISSKGFYIALAVCLMGAGTAAWVAIDRTISSIDNNNAQIIQESMPPKSADVDKKTPNIPETTKAPLSTTTAPSTTQPKPASSSSASSTSAKPSSKPAEQPVMSPDSKLVYILPVKGEILTEFSGGELVRNLTLGDWRTHDGIDIKASKGSDVVCVADGKISSVKYDSLMGTVVEIEHKNGVTSVYCGLEKEIDWEEGDSIKIQEIIGVVDKVPAEVSLEDHVHFALKVDGKWLDPLETMDMLSKNE